MPHSTLLHVFEQQPGRWLSRADLAAALGKIRLHPGEIQQLDELAAAGKLEHEQRPSGRSKTGFLHVYRLPGETPKHDLKAVIDEALQTGQLFSKALKPGEWVALYKLLKAEPLPTAHGIVVMDEAGNVTEVIPVVYTRMDPDEL